MTTITEQFPTNASLSCVNTNPFKLQPERLLQLALHHLSDAGIQLVEWHALLYRRLDVPIIPKNFSYIVAEGDLPSASRLLEIECGLPYSDPEPFLLDTSGDVYGKAILHRLTESKSMGGVKYLALYPDTYVSFLPSELSPNPDPTLKNVWIPDPPALYAALFRMISTYPKTDVSRGAFVTDLSLLIMYHLYPQHDDDSEDDDDEDIEHALATIRGWCQEWRFGEEWIRDALTEVTRTGLVSNLPWWSD